MNKEIAKRAFESAHKELKEKQIDEVKRIVKKTLEKLQETKKTKIELDKEIKILKMDLDDLKEGRLDRISERQEKDKKAKDTSVVIIIKEKEIIREPYNPWYVPYRIIWQSPCYSASSPTNLTITNGDSVIRDNSNSYTINGSTAKNYSVGCYDVNGTVVNFR